jgi:nitrile hydratase subunit beta
VNGIHDMGGMHGFGPIVRERDEPVFHSEWERRTFALAIAMMGRRAFNIDEIRRTIERIPPHRYLTASYYERWLFAVESMLVENGVVARTEIDIVMAALRAGASAPSTSLGSSPGASDGSSSPGPLAGHDSAAHTPAPGGGARALRHDQSYRPRFKAGDRVRARNRNPEGHIRLPRYVRGHPGIVHRDWGVFVFPDTHAHGLGANPQHCYAVAFESRELWGDDYRGADRVYVDLWEDYLDFCSDAATEAAGAKSHGRSARTPRAQSAAKARRAKPVRIRGAKKIAPKPPDA